MKGKIIKSALLISISLVVLTITEQTLIYLMKSSRTDTVGKINQVANHDLESEITIWGASTAYVNFNPKVIRDSLNMSCTNMGIDGTNIDQYNGLLEEYLEYTKSSKILVIAIDIHGGFEDRNKLYHMHNWIHLIDNPKVYNCILNIDTARIRKLKYVPFYSLTQYDKHSIKYMIQSARNITSGKNSTDYNISNNGFRPNGKAVVDTTGYPKNKEQIKIGKRTFNKIRGSLLLAKEKGIKPVLVITPIYYKGYNTLSNAQEVKDLAQSLAKDDISVLDFSNCYISKNHEYFYDNTHLNSKGANEFSRLFANKCKTLIETPQP